MSKLARMVFAGCSIAAFCTLARADDVFTFDHENVMGTAMHLEVRAGSENGAEVAEAAAASGKSIA